MGIIVEDCVIEEHIDSSGQAYDGGTVYKIKMKIDGVFYLSVKDYTLASAIKFRDEWRQSAGYGQ